MQVVCALCLNNTHARDHPLKVPHRVALIFSLGYVPSNISSANLRVCHTCWTAFTRGNSSLLHSCSSMLVSFPDLEEGSDQLGRHRGDNSEIRKKINALRTNHDANGGIITLPLGITDERRLAKQSQRIVISPRHIGDKIFVANRFSSLICLIVAC